MSTRDDLAKLIAASNSVDPNPNAFASAADAVLQDGFIRVSDDSATVERVAKAMARDEVIRETGVTWPGFTFDAHWIDFLSDDDREGYRAKARAAFAALKGDTDA